MQDDLLLYYENELTYLRRLGARFAQQYPKVAARLQLEANKCDDPHVERLLEGFAFLAARIHRRLDDDFPEISEALLDVLYPQLVRPLPAMAIVEMHIDPMQGRLAEGFEVPRGSMLRSRPVQGVPCEFQTCYDTTLWPVTVHKVGWSAPDGVGVPNAVGAVRVELRALPGMKLSEIQLDTLRLHIAGDSNVADTLYELLANNCQQVVVRDPDRASRSPIQLGASAVVPVGFGEQEGMLPLPPRMFAGYRLLQELFAFPQKFHFVDLKGLGPALRVMEAGERVELLFAISPFERAERRQALELGLSARSLRVGCTPAVNLFRQSAEPIMLTERTYEYPVVADARRRLEVEVWSIDDVTIVERNSRTPRTIHPLYANRHDLDERGDAMFWKATRRSSSWRTDAGTDVFIAFSDLSARLRVPDADVVTTHVTCYNADLPSRLKFGTDGESDFELVTGGPIERISCVITPTPTVQPRLGKSLLWRTISSLSLNHLSLADSGVDALRDLLRLHNVAETLSGERQIEGLVSVKSEPAFARVYSSHGVAYARGTRVDFEFNEEHFAGGGMYLFASVLERFLGLYASMNSFTQVSARSRQRRRLVREWPARAGWRALV